MHVRKSPLSKAIFYRGISLKEYIRKSSIFHKSLQYRDQDTIFVDENKNPIPFQEGFRILSQPKQQNFLQNTSPRDSSSFFDLPNQCSNKELPSLHSRRKQIKAKAGHTLNDRNKTDASIHGLQMKLDLLPNLTRNKMRNITDQSQLQPKSQRKKKSQGIVSIEQLNEEIVFEKQKGINVREHTQVIKLQTMLKNRYNVRNDKIRNNKLRHIERVKSYAQ